MVGHKIEAHRTLGHCTVEHGKGSKRTWNSKIAGHRIAGHGTVKNITRQLDGEIWNSGMQDSRIQDSGT